MGKIEGRRAILLAVLVVVLAAALAWALKDGSIFNTATVTGLLGKFGYDGARDVMGQGGTDRPLPSVVGEVGGGQVEEDEVEYGD